MQKGGSVTVPMDDPRDNVLQFKREKREGTLIPVRKGFDGCKHAQAIVDQGTRSVSCATCKAPLDAFTVLYELATKQRRWLGELDAWDAYRDSKLSERYGAVWEERSGDVKAPPEDPEMKRVWDTFREYLGESFCAMYRLKQRKRSGTFWYGRTTNGGAVSYNYAREQLLTKVGKGGSA